MDLNEMKAALEGEAQRKVKDLERYNKNLARENRKKQEQIGQLEEILRVMYNRCYASIRTQTGGFMCLMCGERCACDRLRSVGKGETDGTSTFLTREEAEAAIKEAIQK